MLDVFLDTNRVELIARCRAKVAKRPSPPPTVGGDEDGVPVLIDQLIELLQSPSPNPSVLPAGIGHSAGRHGRELLRRGFTVDQVVHDYGDLCQAITELAGERQEAISVDEFHTFNRCLDSAIADAVLEFGRRRDQAISEQGAQSLNERLGALAHEQRNLLNTAMLAFAAIKEGHVAPLGATGGVLDRSFDNMRDLIDRTLADVRLNSGLQTRVTMTPIDIILAEVGVAARLEANARRITFTVDIEPSLAVEVDRQMLSSAIANLLQNAFKFSPKGSHVSLKARRVEGHVQIEVADHCGGLPLGMVDDLFKPFEQRSADRSGLGLGLSISKRAVEANGGTLWARDIPGTGCVFTIDLPRR